MVYYCCSAVFYRFQFRHQSGIINIISIQFFIQSPPQIIQDCSKIFCGNGFSQAAHHSAVKMMVSIDETRHCHLPFRIDFNSVKIGKFTAGSKFLNYTIFYQNRFICQHRIFGLESKDSSLVNQYLIHPFLLFIDKISATTHLLISVSFSLSGISLTCQLFYFHFPCKVFSIGQIYFLEN